MEWSEAFARHRNVDANYLFYVFSVYDKSRSTTLIAYFEEMQSNDPISKFCYAKLKNSEVRMAFEVLNNVFEELASMCQIFQRRGLNLLNVQTFTHAKINKLRQKYLGWTAFWGEKVDNLLAGVSSEKTPTITTGLLKFMTLLCEHMVKRFPEGEVQDWVAFDCGALKSPS